MEEAHPVALLLGKPTAEHIEAARRLVGEPCRYHATWDPETFAPTGEACGKPSVEVLFWVVPGSRHRCQHPIPPTPP